MPISFSQWADHIIPIPDKARNQIVPRTLVKISKPIFLSIKGVNKGVNRNRAEPYLADIASLCYVVILCPGHHLLRTFGRQTIW